MNSRGSTNSGYFIVEGNIGVGKSTFLRIIQNALKIPVIFEPVYRWQTINGNHNLLDQFYQDPQRWAYTFQTYAFITRIMEQEEYMKKAGGGLYIAERSVFSDRYCFTLNAYEMGLMSELEWQIYKEWFNWLVMQRLTKPSGIIYLQSPAQLCYDRLKKRSRSEEAGISLDYLQRLENKHEAWIINKNYAELDLKDVPVVVLNCSQEFETDLQVQQQFFMQIEELIRGTHHHTSQTLSNPTLYERSCG